MFVTKIISIIFGMMRGAMKTPEMKRPRHMTTKFFSKKTGPVKKKKKPIRKALVIKVTRTSTHSGIT